MNYIDYKDAIEQSLAYFENNNIAAKVSVDKYSLKDTNGRLLEATPREMHKRLAREFARIERNYPNPLSEEEIFGYLDQFKYIIPQGSPMAGIGNPYQVMSISNCVHGNSLVYTKELGLVKMRDIVPGLHVLTHKGRFRKVLRHWSNGEKQTYTIIRSFSGKQVSVRTEQEMGRFCATTPGHRVYTAAGKWETVENLLGKHNKELQAPTITVPDTTGVDLSVLPMGLGRTVLLDEELAWIFGLYFAEGAIKQRNTSSPSVYFTLAKDEMELAERISSWSEVNLGHKAWIQTWEGLNFIQINVFDKFFSQFILDNFGCGFDKKRIPEWIFALPLSVRTAFLDGFMTGDATNYEDLNSDYNVFSIANPTLAYELGLLARSINKKVRFNFQAVGKLIKHRTATVSMSASKEVIKLVKSPVMAEVFDMEVEEDHSFVAGDIICHNCFVVQSPYDSYGGILKTDQEQAQIMKRRGGVGFDISTIRPRGLPTANAAQTTDGIGVFMERFSNTCREVAQGGRRGALMLTLSVHHPEIRTFIHIKEDLKKVTGANISIRLSDEFMTAVKNKEKVQLRFPVDSREPTISEMVDAEELWTEIIGAAHKSAEPGLLFWDTVMRECPTSSYPEFITISTNPCFSSETLIAVADGRNAVSIKQLAEEGKDVSVYSVDPKTGIVSIKTGRHPRITGYNKKLVRVLLDDGSYFDVTPDHKCLLLDGSAVLAKDLRNGMSLPRFAKELSQVKANGKNYYRIHGNILDHKKNLVFEHRLVAQFHNPSRWDEVCKNGKQSGWTKTGGLVVHHKDYNGLNNTPENLEIMTFREHQKFHAEHDNKGENNGRYLHITNAQIKEHAMSLSANLNRRFSNDEWQTYASKNGLPQTFSEWRSTGFYRSPVEMAKACAIELGLEIVNIDPRLARTLSSMLEQGYRAEIQNNQVVVQKICETCRNEFKIQHDQREISFCSHACSLVYINSSQKVAAKRAARRNDQAQAKASLNCQCQAKIFSAFKFKMGREPLFKEWKEACKSERVPSRIGKGLKYGFQNWSEVKEAGNNYNHKVVSVTELSGEHTVYNITVDDNHTVALVTDKLVGREGGIGYSGVYLPQCGEITLSAYDSCRLLLINALSFVKSPFQNPSMDWSKFQEVVFVAQRLMDDIVDLELECIDKIIQKIKDDPEPEEVKLIELNLWNKIRTACINGRRTGLGLTGVGDLVAAMNMRYGSPESIEFVERLYKELATTSYSSSIAMAKERGPFPAFSYELEKNSPFIQRVMAEIPQIAEDYKKYGRRNIANLTTPPAGSTSMLAKSILGYGVSSGIENVLYIRSIRRKKINPNDKDARVDFVDEMGDKWTEFPVYHNGFEAWKQITSKTDDQIKESPYWNSTADDVDWVAKVDMQGVAQKWIDHSISNTTNLPEEADVETVKQVYMRGWENGCKGITIYRKNSRAGVILDDSAKKKETKKIEFNENHAPKRPQELDCDVYHSTIQGEKWTIFVGKLEGKPYELMGGLAKFVNLPKRVRSGKTVKHNGDINPARYDFHYDYDKGPEDETVIRDIGNVFENPVHSAFTRSISLNLRHGVPVQYVCEQLLKGAEKESDLYSFSRVMSRVLKNYIEDGAKTTQKKCPECKSSNLSYQQGCVTCLDCGSSKCG